METITVTREAVNEAYRCLFLKEFPADYEYRVKLAMNAEYQVWILLRLVIGKREWVIAPTDVERVTTFLYRFKCREVLDLPFTFQIEQPQPHLPVKSPGAKPEGAPRHDADRPI